MYDFITSLSFDQQLNLFAMIALGIMIVGGAAARYKNEDSIWIALATYLFVLWIASEIDVKEIILRLI